MAAATSASSATTSTPLHDPLRPAAPSVVNAGNAVPWDEQVVPALRKRLEAESAQLAERIKGSTHRGGAYPRGPGAAFPSQDAGRDVHSSSSSSTSGSGVRRAPSQGSPARAAGSKIDMATARQRARSIRDRRDGSAPISGRGGAYNGQAQIQNEQYSYNSSVNGIGNSASLGRTSSKLGPSTRSGALLASSSSTGSALFPSDEHHQDQDAASSSSYYSRGSQRPITGSSVSSIRTRTQSTPMQYMGPSSSSTSASARYAAAANAVPPIPPNGAESSGPQTTRTTAVPRQRVQAHEESNRSGQSQRPNGQGGRNSNVEMESPVVESSKYGEAMAPRWPSSRQQPFLPATTAAKQRSATVDASQQHRLQPDPPSDSSQLPPSTSDPLLLHSPLSNHVTQPISRSTRAVTEPPTGSTPWDWDEVLPPTIARRVAQEELLKRDPSLQGVEELIDTWDKSGKPLTQKRIRELCEERERRERGEDMGEEPGKAEEEGSAWPTAEGDSLAEMSSSFDRTASNRQVRLSSLVDGMGFGPASSSPARGDGKSSIAAGASPQSGDLVNFQSQRTQQQRQVTPQREPSPNGHGWQQGPQQQQRATVNGHQPTSAPTSSAAAPVSATSGKHQKPGKDDSHDAGCCAKCLVM
ncbi:hypothetical protein BDZ90DRAFT_229087 [Jaminaea rosea]|uniref:Uncharacterized protein n=1 Tax=Jaminaea rosea TaxID=1569628 RepID=A0A316UYI7_9BASI|nr:hypothetical protein BDZ90DRAFT_229087 [Jaminaea rosea]PWN30054.1 hypothetical protein BDZ90DRAFT_229087 [Jaminaea rosea]